MDGQRTGRPLSALHTKFQTLPTTSSERTSPEDVEPIAPESAPPESGPDTRSREQLAKEIKYLRAEVAYLKKLDALIRQEERQTRSAKHR